MDMHRYTLAEPITVTIMGVVYPDGVDDKITVGPEDCPHCGGGHGEYCLSTGKKVEGLFCPYSFDWPHIRKEMSWWHVPPLIQSLMDALLAELGQ